MFKSNQTIDAHANVPERQWEEIKIEMPYGHLSGKWYGNQNEQPVLALHGWMDNAGSFDRLIPLIPKNIPVLSIDLPGHGHSSHLPPGAYYHIFWDYAPVIRRIVKHFGWQNVKLLGHSMGAAACFMYAAMYPKEVCKIIMIDSAGPVVTCQKKFSAMIGSFVDKIHALETMTPAKQPRFTQDEVISMMMDESVIDRQIDCQIDRETAKVLLKRGLKEMPDKKYTFTYDLRLRTSVLGLSTIEQVLDYAERIECHVLNIRPVPGMTFEIADAYPKVMNVLRKKANLEYHEVPGLHHIHIQTPERIANIITAFLLNINEE